MQSRGTLIVTVLVLAAVAPSLDRVGARNPALIAAQQTTAITGMVTARGDDRLRVEFEPHATADPSIGDAVTFTAIIRGIEVGGGAGEVVEAGRDFVWVRRTRGNPGLQMRATIAATGARAAGSGRANATGSASAGASGKPAAGGGSNADVGSLVSFVRSFENDELRGSLEDDRRQFDEARLRTTPQGRATLAAMQRLLASTRGGAVRSDGSLPPGVTERMVADAERALLFRQVVITGRRLDVQLRESGIATRIESGAQARDAIVRGAQAGQPAAPLLPGEDDLSRLKRLVDWKFFMPVATSSPVIRGAVRRLSPDDRRRLGVQTAEFEAAHGDVTLKLSRFSLALGKGAEAEEVEALALHQALFRYRTASLRIVEAADLK